MVRFQLQVDRPCLLLWLHQTTPSCTARFQPWVGPVPFRRQSHLPWLYYSVKTTQPFADLLLVERVLAGLHPQSKRLVEVVVWTHDPQGSTH